jgi:hypothetical protein
MAPKFLPLAANYGADVLSCMPNGDQLRPTGSVMAAWRAPSTTNSKAKPMKVQQMQQCGCFTTAASPATASCCHVSILYG